MMEKKRLLSLCTLAAAITTAATGAALAHHARETAPAQTPMPPASHFSARVDNQLFPLQPGTRHLYTGVKNGEPSRDVVTVTQHTKTIAGVPCIADHDQFYLRGWLEERTTDWYSQDSNGNVWYLGENTAEVNTHGHVTTTSGT
jgi:hypothetical protein